MEYNRRRHLLGKWETLDGSWVIMNILLIIEHEIGRDWPT